MTAERTDTASGQFIELATRFLMLFPALTSPTLIDELRSNITRDWMMVPSEISTLRAEYLMGFFPWNRTTLLLLVQGMPDRANRHGSIQFRLLEATGADKHPIFASSEIIELDQLYQLLAQHASALHNDAPDIRFVRALAHKIKRRRLLLTQAGSHRAASAQEGFLDEVRRFYELRAPKLIHEL